MFVVCSTVVVMVLFGGINICSALTYFQRAVDAMQQTDWPKEQLRFESLFVWSESGTKMVKQQSSPGRRANAPSTKPAVASSDAVPVDVPVIDEPREPLGVESTVVSRETATHLAFAKR